MDTIIYSFLFVKKLFYCANNRLPDLISFKNDKTVLKPLTIVIVQYGIR